MVKYKMHIITFIILLPLLPVLGLFLGSLFDKGVRSDGNIRNDIPSTIGFLIGCLIDLYLLFKS